MSIGKQKDPQNDRRWQWLTDQHGRRWGCTIELTTGEPTGPIDMYRDGNVHEAPIMPPQKFLSTNSKKHHGELRIDYPAWKSSLERAHEDYNRRVLGIAQQMYKDKAVQAIEEGEPALFGLAGLPPEPIGPVEVAEAGDPWMLGLSDERPDWADAPNRPDWVDMFFRKQPKPQAKRPASLAFLDYKKDSQGQQDENNPGRVAETKAPASAESYPLFVKSAGRGISLWKLSNGEEFTGKKDEARAAEAALAGVHESWSDA